MLQELLDDEASVGEDSDSESSSEVSEDSQEASDSTGRGGSTFIGRPSDDSCVVLCCDQLIHQTIGSDRRSEYKVEKIDSNVM